MFTELHDLYAGALGKLSVDKTRKTKLTETRSTVEEKMSQQLQECKGLHGSHFRGGSKLGYPRQLRYALPWTHGFLRSAALRGGADVNADERCALQALIMVRVCTFYKAFHVHFFFVVVCFFFYTLSITLPTNQALEIRTLSVAVITGCVW